MLGSCKYEEAWRADFIYDIAAKLASLLRSLTSPESLANFIISRWLYTAF